MSDFIKVPLSKGRFSVISIEDAEKVLRLKWHLFENKTNGRKPVRYAATKSMKNGKRISIYLHRFIIDAPKGVEVDHINGDGLDNRSSNLRLATRSENARNFKSSRKSACGFRGVFQYNKNKRFGVKITVNKTVYILHGFLDAAEAALFYDLKALELHGDFATLNNPVLAIYLILDARARLTDTNVVRFPAVKQIDWNTGAARFAAKNSTLEATA